MKRLIYYPGFEVKYIDWLKFALLYIETLEPIIPLSGDRYLSDFYKRLMGETDLIHVNRPEYGDGTRATLDAIDVIERILQNPARYLRVFNTPNIVERWRNTSKQDHTLFREKYTDEWKAFCIENGLARHSPKGLLLHKELVFIFMTLLAQSIADSRGLSPITDDSILDRLSILTRRANLLERQKLYVAQSVIELKLPANLSQIDIGEIIRLRGRRGFREHLRAFHQEFDKFFDNIQNGSTERDFVNSFGNIWKDFSDEIVSLGIGAATLGLGVWMLVKSPEITTESYFKEVVLGGASLVAGSTIAFRNAWKNTKVRRYSRKYLADLQRIHRAT